MVIDFENDPNDPSSQFNQIVGDHINKQKEEKETVNFMSHPDNDKTVQEIINYIAKSGGKGNMATTYIRNSYKC